MANKFKGKQGRKFGYRKFMNIMEKRNALKSKFDEIFDIWHEQTKLTGGNFIRHIDGNCLNNSLFNMTMIHPHDAFKHPEWKVDWECGLTQAQISFVREHMDALAERYNQKKYDCNLKGHAFVCNPNKELEILPVEEADKYKEHIGRVWREMCESQ